MKGSVDKVTAEGSIGWLYAGPYGPKPLVQAFLRHQIIGEAVADVYRPDLEQVGLGDGRHGFEMGFSEKIDASHLPFVSLRPEGFDLALPVHGTGLFVDIVHRILTDYPNTARNHSVLGGLWTDRMDASALLAGRIAVGSVAAELQTALSEFIARGHVVFQGAMAARTLGERELGLIDLVARTSRDTFHQKDELRAALSSLAGFLFVAPLLQVLRAVFDDHPVAYRLDVIRTAQPFFAQACSIEALPSPGECMVLYLVGAPGSRVEFVRDSHELAEFSQEGRSRWAPHGTSAIREFLHERTRSIDTVELEMLDLLAVGPGSIHRVTTAEDTPVLRVLVAPRRVTPSRYLSGETSWLEGGHVSGARLRL